MSTNTKPARVTINNLTELTNSGKAFATKADIARVLGLDTATIRKAIAAGHIPSTQLGTARMVPVAKFLAWHHTNVGAPAGPIPAV
jgi:excisionase family DNA binding protein